MDVEQRTTRSMARSDARKAIESQMGIDSAWDAITMAKDNAWEHSITRDAEVIDYVVTFLREYERLV